MKYWVCAIILLGNGILQTTLFPFLQIMGIQPDTLMVLVSCFGLLGGSYYGLLTGLFGGLLQDILYGGSVGSSALLYMVIGYLMGLFYDRIFVGKVLIPAFLVFSGSLLKGLLMMGYFYFTRAAIPPEVGLPLIVLPEALYTAAFMPLTYYLMSLLFRQRFMMKRWSFRRR